MTSIKLGRDYAPWLVGLAVIALAALVLFGFTGFRTIIAIVIMFIIPALLLLKNTGLDAEEKIFFSLFAGLGLFPLLVFSANQVLPSFRLSILAAFILVAVVAFFAPRILQRKQQKL